MIHEYLNGKTRDQIAQDVGISGGKVSGIINDWITEKRKPIAEELRDLPSQSKNQIKVKSSRK